MKNEWKHAGDVGVDGGQLLLIDPAYLSSWKDEPFYDYRRYRNRITGQELQYKVDFPHYQAVIKGYGQCMNQLLETGEWDELPMPPAEHPLSFNAACIKTITETCGNLDLGFVTRTGYGDGVYPVYARFNDEGRVMGLMIDFGLEELEDE